MNARVAGMVSLAILIVAGGVFLLLRSSAHHGPGAVLVDNEQSATHSYTIPPGTFDAIARGEPVSILPAEMDLHVGDSVRVRNDDSHSSVVGPFYIDAHSVMTQRFTSKGTYSGLCTVHPSGKIEIHVTK